MGRGRWEKLEPIDGNNLVKRGHAESRRERMPSGVKFSSQVGPLIPSNRREGSSGGDVSSGRLECGAKCRESLCE